MPSTIITSIVTQDSSNFGFGNVTTAPETTSLPQTTHPTPRTAVHGYEFPFFEAGASLGVGILLGLTIGIMLICVVKKAPKKRNVIQTPLNPVSYSNFDEIIREMHRPDQVRATPPPTSFRNPGPSGSSNSPRKAMTVKRKHQWTQTSATRPYSLVKLARKDVETQTVPWWRESSPESERAEDPTDDAMCESDQSLQQSERLVLYKIIQSSRVIRGVEKDCEELGKIILIKEDQPFSTFVDSQKKLFSESTISTASVSSYVQPDKIVTLRKVPSHSTSDDDDDRYVNTAKLKKPLRKKIHSKMVDDEMKPVSKNVLPKTYDDHMYVNSLKFRKNKAETCFGFSTDIASYSGMKTDGNVSILYDETRRIWHRRQHAESRFILLNLTDDLVSFLETQETLSALSDVEPNEDYLSNCEDFKKTDDPYMRMDRNTLRRF